MAGVYSGVASTRPSCDMLQAMLFMVIERFKTGDVDAIGERFRRKGRMLPDGVTYHASWVDPATLRCFQVMEAATQDTLKDWIRLWNDLVEFEVIPVQTSAEFWASR